jgi:biotin synthase
MYALFERADQVRIAEKGTTVELCGIVNAKSGLCPENCKFCPQSVHSAGSVDCYPLLDEEKIVQAAADAAKQAGCVRFGIVTSGESVADEGEIRVLEKAISAIVRDLDIKPCASLGLLSEETLLRLKDAGLTRCHCNLESAESFFENICTTHKWSDSVETIRRARSVGLSVCSGGIFGLGESLAQRVELLSQIRDLEVDSVPINFLHPVPGTPLFDTPPISALECLKVIAVARLMMPDKTVRVCGGREHNLRDLQSWLLICGADGLMVGNYLTTRGRRVEDDLKMIADAGFNTAVCHDG